MKDENKIENIVKDTKNDVVRKYAQKAMEDSFQGDEVAQKMVMLTKILTESSSPSKSGVDEKEVLDLVKKQLKDHKIGVKNLDAVLKSIINDKPTSVNLTITTAQGAVINKTTNIKAEYKRPVVQKILSDFLARNNVYLYGGAGTGKTYSAGIIAEILDWELIEISCNQFTSPLELIGGQTIDGYQEGKVVRAYGNIGSDGEKMTKDGCILLLDELPKIDPNTAGILNQTLARVGEYKDNGSAASIQNARGQKIERGNIFIMATGNALLNESDSDYEANFKQDLSLQDRFTGSTYEVFVDVEFEWNGILKKQWAFIFIYLNKLRELIKVNKFSNKAFVSIRLMQSAQKTYNVYRQMKSNSGKGYNKITTNPLISNTPVPNEDALTALSFDKTKTVIDTIEEFFNLFSKEQSDKLRKDSDYNGFVKIVKEKDKIKNLDDLNTDSELKEVDDIISKSK